MRFHGLMLVRDEEDIIAQCLEHLLTWIDHLYVLDLGSTDNTWQIVQDFARRDSRIVPHLSKPIVYQDSLRNMLFHAYRERFQPGDWVLKIDADEFYEVLPPAFVRERLRAGETAVHLMWYFFRLTSDEVRAYETGAVDVMEDRKRPIQLRRPMYKITDHYEPRMFRYRRGMKWSEHGNWPHNIGYFARERLPIRHYPHRDPLQMARRYKLRNAMIGLKGSQVSQWKLDDWRKDVVDLGLSADGSVERSDGQGLTAAPGHSEGKLRRWEPGTPLPDVRLYNHVSLGPTRLMQRIVHPLLLPLLDAGRAPFTDGWQPTLIPADVNEKIGRE